MPPIFINTGHDPKEPRFAAKLAGDRAAECEKKIRETITKLIEEGFTFTTNRIKNAKGCSIRLVVSKPTRQGREMSCSLPGEKLESPKRAYMKKRKAPERRW